MTITKSGKFTLDGHTKFSIESDKYTWSGGWISFIDIHSETKTTVTETVDLKGNGWNIGTLNSSGNVKVILTDHTTGTNGDIDDLNLYGSGGSTVTLNRHVESFKSGNGKDTLTLGTGGAVSVATGGGDDKVTAGSGYVEQVALGSGNNTFIGGKGTVNSVTSGEGNDIFTVNDGNVGTINMGSGKNTLSVVGKAYVNSVVSGNGNDTLNYTGSHDINNILLSSGNNTLKLAGSGYVNSIVTYEGNDTVNYTGSQDVNSILLGSGKNIVTLAGSANVNSIVTYGGDDTVTVKGSMKFVDNISLGGGNNTITTTSSFVSSIITNEGNDTIKIGGDGAGQIVSWGGNDTVTVSSWVGAILLGAGNDKVNLMANGTALSVMLRDGNDSLSVSEVTSAAVKTQTCMFNGGDGKDTISFAKFAVGLEISLASSNAVDTGKGVFIIRNFENLTGGSHGDKLTGSSVGNILDGGAGNDILTGGGGKDIFVFTAKHGNDTVTDFSKAGGDRIDLSGLTGIDSFADLSAGHITQHNDDTVITGHNGETLTLTDIVKTTLTSSQFIF